jgi:hypothetical protein
MGYDALLVGDLLLMFQASLLPVFSRYSNKNKLLGEMIALNKERVG